MQVFCKAWLVMLSVVYFSDSFSLKAQDSQAWQINGLLIQSQNDGVHLQLDSIKWQDLEKITAIDYHCFKELPLFPKHRCNDAQLSLVYGGKTYAAILDSQFEFQSQYWQLALSTNQDQLVAVLSSDSQLGQINFKQLDIQSIVDQFIAKKDQPILPTGLLSGDLQFDLDQFKLASKEPLLFEKISYEYSDDVIVAELEGALTFDFDIRNYKLSYELSLTAGEMLLNEVYVDFSSYPVTVKGQVTQQQSGWYLVDTEIINKQSLALSAQVSVNKAFEWQFPTVNALITDSHHFNQEILGSVLGIYGFGNSGMSGQFKVAMASNEEPFDQWSIDFNDYYFLNERRRIAAESLNGRINWHRNQANDDSNLSWQKLQLAGLPIDSAAIKFNFSQDQFQLVGAQLLPVLNGAIQLGELKLAALFSESIEMKLNASILPISLKLITESMGWPVMSGTISGDIPGMVKQGSVIEFLGALNLKVFEGSMLIDNLSLERLFGVAPVIAADIKFDGFDLSLLTETFGFGLITGKLSGTVNELRVTNWKTDRLDAEVYTVKTKGIKQIISQRAIDNISSLGGIKGAISKTFLRFFDDFRYRKIKLSCKLHNSVCEIGGLKNQNNQFVIVEGGGIPKINIVGYVRSINWQEFVSRLLNANYDN